jgi:hypothetical protein
MFIARGQKIEISKEQKAASEKAHADYGRKMEELKNRKPVELFPEIAAMIPSNSLSREEYEAVAAKLNIDSLSDDEIMGMEYAMKYGEFSSSKEDLVKILAQKRYAAIKQEFEREESEISQSKPSAPIAKPAHIAREMCSRCGADVASINIMCDRCYS